MNDRPTHDEQDDLEGFDTYESDIQDDLPADDTISDADFQDVSDEVDADVFGDSEPAPAPKKKTNWFNIGVATCAIVVAGGLVWSKLGPQMMGGPEQTQVSMPADMTGEQLANTNAGDSQAAIAQALQPLPNPNEMPTPANAGGMLDNPEGYANLAQMPAPDTVPVKQETAVDPFAGLPAPAAPVTQVAETSAVPMPAPIASAPMPAATTTVTTSVTTPAPVAAPIAAAPVETVAPNAAPTIESQPLVAPITAQMPASVPGPVPVMVPADVTTKMDAMEARLDALDSKLSQIQTTAAAPANDDRLNAIQATLQRLEGRLDDMSSKKTAVRSVSIDNDDIAPAPVKKKAAPKKSKPKAKAAPAQWDDAYAPQAARAVPAVAGSGWQLRGAKPGSAIIAKGNDIREVVVGDSVPGLGRIGAVSNNSGRWMVQGSQATLSQ